MEGYNSDIVTVFDRGMFNTETPLLILGSDNSLKGYRTGVNGNIDTWDEESG